MGELDNIKRKCRMLKGCEKIESITSLKGAVEMLYTPQGREFFKKTGFPDIETLRSVSHKTDCGIVADEGRCSVGYHDVIITGDTNATLYASKPTKLYRVIVAHGATVRIVASQYAVVTATNIGGNIAVSNDGTAKVTIE